MAHLCHSLSLPAVWLSGPRLPPQALELRRHSGARPHGKVLALTTSSSGRTVWSAGMGTLILWDAYSGGAHGSEGPGWRGQRGGRRRLVLPLGSERVHVCVPAGACIGAIRLSSEMSGFTEDESVVWIDPRQVRAVGHTQCSLGTSNTVGRSAQESPLWVSTWCACAIVLCRVLLCGAPGRGPGQAAGALQTARHFC